MCPLSSPALGGIMAPTLSAQLSLGLCLCWVIWAQEDLLPKPSLRAEPGLVIPYGKPVTLWCEGPLGADQYLLRKEGKDLNKEKSVDGRGAHLLISNMTAETAGRYQCLYREKMWSETSDTLELIMSGHHDAPYLSAVPSSQVTSGQEVTFQCQVKYGSSALYKDGEQIIHRGVQTSGWGAQTNFSFPAVTPVHGGTYRCYSIHSNNPYVWSAPSNPLVLRVTGTPGLSSLPVDILMGTSIFLILLVLFLLLLLCYRCWRRRTRLSNGGREAEMTPRSSDSAGTPLEETLDVDLGEDRQTEEARPEDPAAPHGQDDQEVTYALLNLNSLKMRAEDLPPSGAGDSSLYATLR